MRYSERKMHFTKYLSGSFYNDIKRVNEVKQLEVKFISSLLCERRVSKLKQIEFHCVIVRKIATFSKRCWICIRMVRQPVIFILLVIISSDNKTKKWSWGNQEWLILRDILVNYAQVIRDMNQWGFIVHRTCYLPVVIPLFPVFNRGFSPRSLTPSFAYISFMRLLSYPESF